MPNEDEIVYGIAIAYTAFGGRGTVRVTILMGYSIHWYLLYVL